MAEIETGMAIAGLWGCRVATVGEWGLRTTALEDMNADRIDSVVAQIFGGRTYDPLHNLLTADDAGSGSAADVAIAAHRDAIANVARRFINPGPTPARLAADLRSMREFKLGQEIVDRPRITSDDDDVIPGLIAKAGAGTCVCREDHRLDGGAYGAYNGEYTPSPTVTVIGSLCADCRDKIFPVPEGFVATVMDADGNEIEHRDNLIPHAIRYQRHPHRCDTCLLSFESPRKLAAHKTTEPHKTLAWIEYQRSIGNVIIRTNRPDAGVADSFGGVIVNLFGLRENEPGPLGWWRTAAMPTDKAGDVTVAGRAFQPIGSLLAVKPSIIALCQEAIASLIDLELARIRNTPISAKFKKGWDPQKPYAQRIRVAVYPLLVAMAAHRAGIKIANPWMRIAWGLGPVEQDDTAYAGRLAHRIHEARREAFKYLGASFFAIPHQIWGKYPGKLPSWAE